MRDATRMMMVISIAAGLAACSGGEGSPDQNIAIDNIGAPTDVDVLPADESSVTATNALVNGTTDDPDVLTADNQTDSY